MATIIKSLAEAAAGSSTEIQPVAFNLHDMADQAGQYLSDVQRQAEQIVADADQQVDTRRQLAEKEGRDAALRAVQKIVDEKVAKQMETLLPALRQSIEQIQDSRHAWLAQWEKNAVKVACQIASRLVRREIGQHPEISLELLREALELAAGSSDITVHLNPEDHKNLGSQAERLAQELCHLSPSSVVADDLVSSGGCRVETKFGMIDQQIESQLDRMLEEMTS